MSPRSPKLSLQLGPVVAGVPKARDGRNEPKYSSSVWSSGGQLRENVDNRLIKSSAAARRLEEVAESRGLRISSDGVLFVTPLMYIFTSPS
jgi:hypothetical protein